MLLYSLFTIFMYGLEKWWHIVEKNNYLVGMAYGVQIKVEDFFSLFFSDDAVGFVESFHRNCGDKGSLVLFSFCAWWIFTNVSKAVHFLLPNDRFYFAFQILNAVRGLLILNLGIPVKFRFSILLRYILVQICIFFCEQEI